MHKVGFRPREIIDTLGLFEKFSSQFQKKDIKAYSSPDEILNTYKQEVVMKRAAKSRKGREKSEPRASEEDRVVVYEDEYLFVIK